LAIDASDGSQIWESDLGSPVPLALLPCGDIDPVGITGTPVIDADTRVIYADAMTTPDGGVTLQHLIFALSLDDGSVLPGWPLDVSGINFRGHAFNASFRTNAGRCC
jgi:outer membrane protein assembly factor BamB